jgi:hypothetical protein
MAKRSKQSQTDPEVWQKTITETMNWRRSVEDRKRWKDFIKEYKNEWEHITSKIKIPVLPLNLVFAYVKTEIARLYFQDPYISVNPKRPQDIESAKVAEQLLNYYWRKLELKQQIKRIQTDAHLVGHGWAKIGYTADFGAAEYDVKGTEEVELNEFIKNDDIFSYRVPWQDILFSPDSNTPPYDCRWIAHRIIRPYDALMQSQLYENLNGLQPVTNPNFGENPYLRTYTQVAVLWEIWDRDTKQVLTIAEGHDKFLRQTAWPYEYITGFPFIMYRFNDSPDEPYPISDIAMQEPLLVELMKLMAIMTNHLKRWNRQIFMQRGFMLEEEMAKFEQGVDGAVCITEGVPTAGIFIPPYAPVQSDIYGVWNLIMDMWRNVGGQSELERGAAAKTQTRTLGELRLTLTGGRARADEKVDMLEDSMEEHAKKMLQIMQQSLSVPKMIRIVGNRPEELMNILQKRPSAQLPGAFTSEEGFSATKEDIQGEFDVEIVAGSTVPLNKENRLRLLEQIGQIFPTLGIVPGSQASRELGKAILREINIVGAEKIYQIADQEAQIAQAQQQQMQAVQQLQIQGAQPNANQLFDQELANQIEAG